MKILQLPDTPLWREEVPLEAEILGVALPLAVLQLPLPGLALLPVGGQVLVCSFLAVLLVAASFVIPLRRRWLAEIREDVRRFSAKTVFLDLIILLAGCAAIKSGVEKGLTLLGIPFAEEQELLTLFKSLSGMDFAAMTFAVVVLVPGCEELMFRRLLYGCLRRKLPVWPAVVVQAVLFAALHASKIAFLPLVFFGIMQAVCYLKTRSIAVPAAVHVLFNALTVVGIFLGW